MFGDLSISDLEIGRVKSLSLGLEHRLHVNPSQKESGR